MLFNDEGLFYCPLCDDFFISSDYLKTVLGDNAKVLHLSNLVCHYRHRHVHYYNRWVGYHSRYRDYDSFKIEVNNRAKRNILRKCKKFLREHNFTVQDFIRLRHTDQKTLDLAHKILGGTPVYLDKPKKIITLDSFID